MPVTIAGGFLGAGKTTLVNHMLGAADGRRLVVFVNDFGDINIDAALIETVERDQVSLKNGCVCCTLNDDLVRSMTTQARTYPSPDAFVIETSGVSDPRQLRSSIDLLESAGVARLDAQLYVLDADGFEHLDYDDREQIIDHANGADLILLNKCDLVSAHRLEVLESLLKESAPQIPRIHTAHCAIDQELLFGPIERLTISGQQPAATSTMTTKVSSNHKHYESIALESADPLDKHQFEQFVATLPQHCIRAKGIVRFSSDPGIYNSFNLVGSRATLERMGGDIDGPCRLVVIGEKSTFKADEIRELFDRGL